MAKPIKATPILVGKDADVFVEKMMKVENSRITIRQRRIARQIKKNMCVLTVC